MIHHLKTFPEYFQSVIDGKKPFEIRNNDRDFKPGDKCILKEYAGKKEYSECPDYNEPLSVSLFKESGCSIDECPLKREECGRYYEDIYTGRDCLIKIKDVFQLDKAGLPGYVAFTFELRNVREKK